MSCWRPHLRSRRSHPSSPIRDLKEKEKVRRLVPAVWMKDGTPSSSRLFHHAETNGGISFLGTDGAFVLQGGTVSTQHRAQREGCQRFSTQQTGRAVLGRTPTCDPACLNAKTYKLHKTTCPPAHMLPTHTRTHTPA